MRLKYHMAFGRGAVFGIAAASLCDGLFRGEWSGLTLLWVPVALLVLLSQILQQPGKTMNGGDSG